MGEVKCSIRLALLEVKTNKQMMVNLGEDIECFYQFLLKI